MLYHRSTNLGWVAIIGLAAGVLLTSGRAARGDCPSVAFGSTRHVARRLEQVAAALIDYHDANGSLPPAFVTDGGGTPLLSWRVLILPYLGEADLFAQFDLTKAWDDPVNQPLLNQMPAVFRGRGPNDSIFTSIVGVYGAGAAFDGATGVPFSAMTDGTANTAMLGEVFKLVPWTKPEDVDVDANPGVGPSGFIGGTCVPFALANGSAVFVSDTTSAAAFANFYDRADGQVTSPVTCLTVGQTVFQADERIVVGGPVEVEGNLFVNGRLLVRQGHGSTFAGDLVSVGDVRMRPGSAVTGDVIAGGTATVDPSVTVSGTILSNAPVQSDGWVGIGGGGVGLDVEVVAGMPITLPPGDYGNVVIRNGAHLTFVHDGSSGDYNLRGLRLGRDAVLTLDVSNGLIRISTFHELTIGRGARVDLFPNGESDANEACFSHGGATVIRVGPDATVLGQIHASQAKVLLKPGTRLKGHVSGKRVIVGKNGRYVDLNGILD